MFELDIVYKNIDDLKGEERERVDQVRYEKMMKEMKYGIEYKGSPFPLIFYVKEKEMEPCNSIVREGKEKEPCDVIIRLDLNNEIDIVVVRWKTDTFYCIEVLYHKKIWEKIKNLRR